MNSLVEIGYEEKQVFSLSSTLNKYRDKKISEDRNKKPSEKLKQLPLPFCG